MKHTVEVMISEQEVAQRIRELGQQITEHYQGSSDLVLVGLLRGSFGFYGGSCSSNSSDSSSRFYDRL